MKHTGYTPGPWIAHRHEPGNDVQHGLAGYSIQAASGEGIAYNICDSLNAVLIADAPNLAARVARLESLLREVSALTGHDVARLDRALADRVNQALADEP